MSHPAFVLIVRQFEYRRKMASYFGLLRLPHLAFYAVIEHFGLTEIVLLSLCSKRTLRLLINRRNDSDAVKIRVEVSRVTNDLCLSWEGRNDVVRINVYESLETNPSWIGSRIKVTQKTPWVFRLDKINLELHWNGWFDGLRMCIDHVTSLFKSQKFELILSDKKNPNRVKEIADFMMSRQNKIQNMVCIFRNLTDEEISRILNNCIPTDDLHLAQDDRHLGRNNSREYRIDFPPYDLEQAVMTGSIKLTLNHLKSFNCRIFCANGVKMSMKDMNGFLKHCINGGSSRTGRFYIGTEAFNMEVMFDGIEMVERNDRIVRRITLDKGNVYEVTSESGFDITRNDGRVATIQNPNDDPFFDMLVWDLLAIDY